MGDGPSAPAAVGDRTLGLAADVDGRRNRGNRSGDGARPGPGVGRRFWGVGVTVVEVGGDDPEVRSTTTSDGITGGAPSASAASSAPTPTGRFPRRNPGLNRLPQ